MRRAGFAASCLFLTSVGLVAIVGACTSFSGDTPGEDGGASDVTTTGDSAVVDRDTGVVSDAALVSDAGLADAAEADALGDGAPRTCGTCPSGTVCDDGTCLQTPCAGDGGVVILRPKALVDSNGVFANTPVSLSTEATLRERGDGDGDGTYVEARIGTTSASLKLSSELFVLPPDRTIDSVYIRARSRRVDMASSATIGLIYWFPTSNSILGQTFPTAVGTGYGIANFYLKAPYIITPTTTWTEQNVNDVLVGVGIDGVPTNAPEAAVRLTQVWVEVCLNAL